MIEIERISQASLYLRKAVGNVFNISIILITIFLIISLVLWLIGIKIKSEKAIKNGIRLSLSMTILEILMFGIIIFIAGM